LVQICSAIQVLQNENELSARRIFTIEGCLSGCDQFADAVPPDLAEVK